MVIIFQFFTFITITLDVSGYRPLMSRENCGVFPFLLMTLINLELCSCDDVTAMKPNILFILADDIGVNDVSWNNPSAKTPNLGSLADTGIILDSAYTLPVCSPSRAALMTGIYPYKFGFQVMK